MVSYSVFLGWNKKMVRRAHHRINRFAKEAIIALIFRCTLFQCISAEVFKYKHPNFALRFVVVRTSPLQRENRFKNNCLFFCNGQPFSFNKSLVKCRFCVGIHCCSLLFRQNSIAKKRLSSIYLVCDCCDIKILINCTSGEIHCSFNILPYKTVALSKLS